MSMGTKSHFFAPLVFVVLLSNARGEVSQAPVRDSQHSAAPNTEIARLAIELESRSFTKEQEARRFENEGIVPFWDKLLSASVSERWSVFADVPFSYLVLPEFRGETRIDLGIKLRQFVAGGNRLDSSAWSDLLENLQTEGFQIDHTDWHQESFERDESGLPHSEIRFNIQASRDSQQERHQIKGSVRVLWDESGPAIVPQAIEVLKCTVASRFGPVPFVDELGVNTGTSARPTSKLRNDYSGVCVFDLNGDQLPEILVANANMLLWNKGNWQFEMASIIEDESQSEPATVGVVADFNGDGRLDWLTDAANHLHSESGSQGLQLFLGQASGGFSPRPLVSKLPKPLKHTTCLTAGDIDADGDLDLFVGQWRSLYEKMPAKYWDANDGYGNSLLLNDGAGNFTDATVAAGLEQKRYRRTYSASFVDLDDDLDLDLLVVSDFAGVDVYLNDGTGSYSDRTSQFIDEHHLFGMSHTFADYDRDGQLDFYALGMGSTTARRLDRMKANPADFAQANSMRKVMGYGNRMYLASEANGFSQPKYMDQVARTGWSWGATSLDYDNDGDQDIYVTNGHISGSTTRDYCSKFWCRDVNLLPDFDKLAIDQYLSALPQIDSQSWDGYQTNALLNNQGGQGFYDIAYLLGIGFDFDARRTIAADFDLDGRVDLLVTQLEGTDGIVHQASGEVEPARLFVMRNELAEAKERNWIGVSLEGDSTTATLGASVRLTTPSTQQAAAIVSGDSYMAQHPAQKHFGLGKEDRVTELRINWPNGKVTTLENPEINRYHRVRVAE